MKKPNNGQGTALPTPTSIPGPAKITWEVDVDSYNCLTVPEPYPVIIDGKQVMIRSIIHKWSARLAGQPFHQTSIKPAYYIQAWVSGSRDSYQASLREVRRRLESALGVDIVGSDDLINQQWHRKT